MSKNEPAPDAPKNAPVQPDDGKKTPQEWARATGRVLAEHRDVFRFNGEPAEPLYAWQHAAAAQLHGWHDHAHHEGAPIRLTKDEYEAALKASEAPVTRALDKDGKPSEPLTPEQLKNLGGKRPLVTDYEPHPAALSKHAAVAKLAAAAKPANPKES